MPKCRGGSGRAWCIGGLLAVAALAHGAFAQEMQEGVQEAPWFRELQRALRAAWVPPGVATRGKVSFVVGAEALHPGKQFESSDNWLALACSPTGCRLVPAVLATSELRQGKVASVQHLRFQGPATPGGKFVAWFKANRTLAWLAPGDVVTYYDGSHRPLPTGPGTEEARIDLPGSAHARLVPMLLREPGPDDEWPPALLQLRAEGRRQMLLGQLGLCSFKFDAARYLLWAGDLDRDGRPDYLISFVDGNGPLHLYLSSEAKAGELVGLAGIYNVPKSNIKCGHGDS